MDTYQAGSTMYLTGMALTGAAIRVGGLGNPLFSLTSRTSLMCMGSCYSSPSDIQDDVQRREKLNKDVIDVNTAIDAASSAVTEEQWKKMGREEFERSKASFKEENDKFTEYNTDMSRALNGIANLSFGGAVVTLAGGGALLGCAFVVRASAAGGPVTLVMGSSAAALASARVRMTMANMLRRGVMAWGVGATIVYMIDSQISSMLQGKLSKTESTGSGTAPAFEQVFIENLKQPVSGQSQSSALGESQYPTSGQSQYTSTGQSQYPTTGQSQYTSTGQSQYPTTGQSQYTTTEQPSKNV